MKNYFNPEINGALKSKYMKTYIKMLNITIFFFFFICALVVSLPDTLRRCGKKMIHVLVVILHLYKPD